MVTQQKVTELIQELRSWDEEDRYTGNELVVKFNLDEETVKKIAASEGIVLRWVDPNATTVEIDPQEVGTVLQNPDPNPDWVDEDKDTGIWKRDRDTGKWSRIED